MSKIEVLNDILHGFDIEAIETIIIRFIPAIICITIHECCHGLTALILGDDTAKRAGRLTLNPIKHIDIYGLLMLAVLGFGWAKPVPINSFKFKNPKRGMVLTALAGPVSNIILAAVTLFICSVILKVLPYGPVGIIVCKMLIYCAQLSIGLAIFNLIPIPPLDGSKVLAAILSDELYFKLMKYEKYGMIVLILLSFSGILGTPLSSCITFVFNKFVSIFCI